MSETREGRETQQLDVFVVGLDDDNLETLREVPGAEQITFHPLLSVAELQEGEIDFDGLLRQARATLDAFDGHVDAVVGYWDFPVSALVPLLCAERGLRATSVESIVRCEHKYWSRLLQREAAPEAVPGFGLVDLDETDPRPPEGVSFPMWLKPVKSYSSELAFGVKDEAEFRKAVEEIRAGIGRMGEPFSRLMEGIDLPPEIAEAGGAACLAEEALTGVQVAAEGYVHDGEVVVYGVLDSHTYPNSACFLRHQYPADLPEETTRRVVGISRRVMERTGLDSATFSIEFFYDPETGDVKVLEINPRHSQSHAEMFAHVDGVPNHHRMLSLALGRDPRVRQGHGTYEYGAKWYYRRFRDGIVHRVPTAEEIAEVEREVPGVKVVIVPDEGVRLSEMPGQDSYSAELAHLYVGADSDKELEAKYDRAVRGLRFEIEDV
ncbi:ATP-grasp domain-containing protein [Streptomyces sp. SID11385]|uniref:ATP-grasp domain-containing protein n=1 Tax=Streptomyces sp. SID11385 TaxID=2706031 RepID=UPI0013CAD0CE|nr:ATP-grasp domain-containing protein [Streptomyces sp. SID11385]